VIGGFAIGALAIGRLAIRRGRIDKFALGELTVARRNESATGDPKQRLHGDRGAPRRARTGGPRRGPAPRIKVLFMPATGMTK